MILTPLALDIEALKLGDSGGVRAPGVHASDIYGDYYRSLDPERYDSGKPAPPLLFETGLIFETMLEEGLLRRCAASGDHIVRPGEFTFNDVYDEHAIEIHYNPDLFIYEGEQGLRVGEIKATWLSSKVPHKWVDSFEAQEKHREDLILAMMNPKFAKYQTQIQFYCYMLKTRLARLYVCCIAGDYTRPYRTQLLPPVDIEYEQDELDRTYRILMDHAICREMF